MAPRRSPHLDLSATAPRQAGVPQALAAVTLGGMVGSAVRSGIGLWLPSVDSNDKIEGILPTLDAMIGDGLVSLERVDVRVYRANHR